METLERYFNARIAAFLKSTGMSPTTFGMRAVGDPNLMRQIAEGRSLSLRMADRVLAFIDGYDADSDVARTPPHRPRQRRRWPKAAAGRTRGGGAMADRPSKRRTDESIRFIRASEIAARLGVARSTIYGWVEVGRFPPPIHLGPRVVGWIRSEFDAWVHNRIAETRGGGRSVVPMTLQGEENRR
ncbi:helix-turn-helix transcriptional regulator [Candidatus Palauibacter sp.]|uniref:helix-turn-helix transcriptional regulator n=1 Tax=Candidatus Palauibacter sp. TaxID=3101350 RepID=UPI003B52F089